MAYQNINFLQTICIILSLHTSTCGSPVKLSLGWDEPIPTKKSTASQYIMLLACILQQLLQSLCTEVTLSYLAIHLYAQ